MSKLRLNGWAHLVPSQYEERQKLVDDIIASPEKMTRFAAWDLENPHLSLDVFFAEESRRAGTQTSSNTSYVSDYSVPRDSQLQTAWQPQPPTAWQPQLPTAWQPQLPTGWQPQLTTPSNPAWHSVDGQGSKPATGLILTAKSTVDNGTPTLSSPAPAAASVHQPFGMSSSPLPRPGTVHNQPQPLGFGGPIFYSPSPMAQSGGRMDASSDPPIVNIFFLGVSIRTVPWLKKAVVDAIDATLPPAVKQGVKLLLLAETSAQITETHIFQSIQRNGNHQLVGHPEAAPTPRIFIETLAAIARARREARDAVYQLVPSLDPGSKDKWNWNSNSPISVFVKVTLGTQVVGPFEAKVDLTAKFPSRIISHQPDPVSSVVDWFAGLSRVWNQGLDQGIDIGSNYPTPSFIFHEDSVQEEDEFIAEKAFCRYALALVAQGSWVPHRQSDAAGVGALAGNSGASASTQGGKGGGGNGDGGSGDGGKGDGEKGDGENGGGGNGDCTHAI
ncbi:hypothetical protein F4818DRAFT_451825 [Hypoxylon cercidicola]|nr:hypothetical protein F4818DRAFT_451825 [Hypoxylon cercidicola]